MHPCSIKMNFSFPFKSTLQAREYFIEIYESAEINFGSSNRGTAFYYIWLGEARFYSLEIRIKYAFVSRLSVLKVFFFAPASYDFQITRTVRPGNSYPFDSLPAFSSSTAPFVANLLSTTLLSVVRLLSLQNDAHFHLFNGNAKSFKWKKVSKYALKHASPTTLVAPVWGG